MNFLDFLNFMNSFIFGIFLFLKIDRAALADPSTQIGQLGADRSDPIPILIRIHRIMRSFQFWDRHEDHGGWNLSG